MRNLYKTLIATTFATAAIAAPFAASAETLAGDNGSAPTKIEKKMTNGEIPAAATDMSAEMTMNDGFAIKRIDNLTDSEAAQIKAKSQDPAAVKEVHAEIMSDPAAMKALEARSVEVANVVFSQKAADGSTVYYVK